MQLAKESKCFLEGERLNRETDLVIKKIFQDVQDGEWTMEIRETVDDLLLILLAGVAKIFINKERPKIVRYKEHLLEIVEESKIMLNVLSAKVWIIKFLTVLKYLVERKREDSGKIT
jgi:hypothetical protein